MNISKNRLISFSLSNLNLLVVAGKKVVLLFYAEITKMSDERPTTFRRSLTFPISLKRSKREETCESHYTWIENEVWLIVFNYLLHFSHHKYLCLTHCAIVFPGGHEIAAGRFLWHGWVPGWLHRQCPPWGILIRRDLKAHHQATLQPGHGWMGQVSH